MKQSLNLKLSQQLTLTPQLKQSLRLLQLSTPDLEQEIQQTLDTNPLLERVEKSEGTHPQTQSKAEESNAPQPISEAADPSLEMERTDHLAPEQDLSLNWQELSAASHPASTAPNTTAGSAASQNTEFTQFVSKQETLFEHVNWQIQMTALSAKDKLIARTILRSLDDDGYLMISLTEICSLFEPELEVEEDEIAAVLSLIKTLEPIGLGVRDLNERLVILLTHQQAKLEPCTETPGDTNKISTNENVTEKFKLAKQIVSEHLDLLAARNTAKLKKEFSVSDDQLNESLTLITHLNPRITNQFTSDNENYVIPDIVVKKNLERWVAELNPDSETKLRLNKTYADMLKRDINEADSDFIQQNMLQAKMVIKGLMSRYDTLLLVGQSIVERQHAFFEHGEEQMQPMVLQDIADSLDMHESTISRATAGKYLLSSRGVFELKYFFSSALSNTDGAASSSTAIRSLIKKMVNAESKSKPLSDNKIAIELEQQGHIVARRTVAKYRESMQIAASSQRKSLV